MDNMVAIILEIYDLFLPGVPTSVHKWGRVVWLYNIEVGLNGQFLFVKDGKLRITTLSRISKIIQRKDCFEIHTQSSLYKLRYLS